MQKRTEKFLSEKEAQSKFGRLTKKYIDKFIKRPIRNVIGKKWVQHNLILRSPQKKKKMKDPISNTRPRSKGIGSK